MAEGLLDKANIILTPTGYKAGTMYNVAPIEQPYEDFDFARASVASRVNSSGLVEMVGRTLGSNLVQNGDFSEIGPDLVQNGTFDLGSELVTNGDFSDGTNDWINNASAILSIENDRLKVTVDGAGSGYGQQDIIGLTVGKTYQINAEGEIGTSTRLALYTPNAGFNNLYSDGTISTTFIATSTTENLRLYVYDDGAYGFWDNVSVKEVPDWTLTQATVSNNTLQLSTTDGSYTAATQSLGSIGESYKIQLDVSNIVGTISVAIGGGTDVDITTNGTHTIYIKSASTTFELKRKFGITNVSASITNVVVKQLDPNDYWTLGGGSTIGNNKANIDGDGSTYVFINQSNIFTNQGATYKVTADVVITSGLGLKFQDGVTNENIGAATTTGSYTFYFTAGSNSTLVIARRTGGTAFESSVTNIVVKEVIDTNNIPRINYDSNGENGHWLLEPTSTNLVGYSLPNDTNWSKGSNTTITENYAVSPDGTQNASRLVMPTGSGTYAYYEFTATSTTDHTLSFYAKNNGGDADVTMAFFMASQTQSITLTNEWQRFEFTTSITSGNTVQVGVDNITSVDMLIFGVQCEALPYATSYIPTYGSTVTRATETANGAGSADLINSTEGVLYAEIAALVNDSNYKEISISDGTSSNRIEVRIILNKISFTRRINGVEDSGSEFIPSSIFEFNKVALRYNSNEYSLFVGGVLVASDTVSSAYSPNTFTSLQFNSGAGASKFYGNVKTVAVFDEALENDELTELTS